MHVGIITLPDAPWDELAGRARTVEDAGFDSVATGDHMRHPFDGNVPFLDGWSILAGWATVTSTVRLAMLVSNVIYRNPAVLAKQAVAVDHLSSGRLDVGVGAGVFDTDHAMAGIEKWRVEERIGRTEETLLIVDRLLRGVFDDFNGRWYSVRDAAMAPASIQAPRPPIVLGANHPRMLRLAARHADVWNTWGGYGLDEAAFLRLTEERVATIERACDEADRDPTTLRRSVLVHHSAFRPWDSPRAFGSIVERFEALGFDECVMYWPEPHERVVFDRVATDVLPNLRDADQTRRTARPGVPKAVVERYIHTLVNEGDFGQAAEVLAEGCRADEPSGELVGRDAIVANLKRWRDSFPGLRLRADDLIAERDQVVWQWRLDATHSSGRHVDLHGIIVFTIRDGRVASYRGVYDRSAFERQLSAP